jgi:hypothetical protein
LFAAVYVIRDGFGGLTRFFRGRSREFEPEGQVTRTAFLPGLIIGFWHEAFVIASSSTV